MKKTILVSGASGIVGYGILRSLGKSESEYKLIGTTTHAFSIAPAFCDIFEKALPTDHPDYMGWLCDIIKKHSVDMIIPGIECDMFQWNKDREKIISTGALPLLNNSRLIELCGDKWSFYEELKINHAKYAIPTTLNDSFSTFSLPFLLKPRRGYGSKGIVKVNDEKDFEKHKHKIGTELMMQPIIGSEEEEYTVSAFHDNNSQLIDHISLRRKLSSDGFTQEAQVVDFDFSDVINDLAEIFKPIGPTNYQFRVQGEKIALLEINPRISSATSIRACLGYNESIMSVNYFLNNHIPIKLDKSQIINIRAIRFVEDHIFR
jgi:carbamoyl-phosphate synthase large subunit